MADDGWATEGFTDLIDDGVEDNGGEDGGKGPRGWEGRWLRFRLRGRDVSSVDNYKTHCPWTIHITGRIRPLRSVARYDEDLQSSMDDRPIHVQHTPSTDSVFYPWTTKIHA